jgi:hypothetical protein
MTLPLFADEMPVMPALGRASLPYPVGGRLLAIDPGNTESAYVVIEVADRKPVDFGKMPNRDLLDLINNWLGYHEVAVIEMVASYGMAVGAEVFETCVWIGRFYQALVTCGRQPELVKRLPVKTHHCHDSKAKDSNIRQALVDRFAAGQPNHGKGTKKQPGWFYGFHADVWAAYALAVYTADTLLAIQVEVAGV